MCKGITYAGEIAELGQGTNPSDIVEIVCTDPLFLERAAEKKPNFVVRLIEGAYSYPRNWWCGIGYCAMQHGLFGAHGKAMSDPWRRHLVTILGFCLKNPTLAMRLISVALQHQMTSPEFYGRIGGGFFYVLCLWWWSIWQENIKRESASCTNARQFDPGINWRSSSGR
jgi:hypothetical protein